MTPEAPASTLGALLHQLRDEATTLLRQEVALAKAEINEKASRLGGGVLALALGGALAFTGLLVLLLGVAHLVGRGLVALGVETVHALWLGPVLLGAVVAILGISLMAAAKQRLAAEKLVPRHALESLGDDKRWAQEKITPAK